MSPISITFDTSINSCFQWYDSFKGLADKELEEIVVHCRSATTVFFIELSNRRKLWKNRTLENYHDMLLKNVNRINRRGLIDEHEGYLKNLYSFLADSKDAQIERNETKVARQYLWLVSRVIGWFYALLILCALSKHRLQKLDEDQRVKLVKYITQHRDFLFCSKLANKVFRCKLHHIRMNLPLYILISIELLQMLK